MTHLIDSKLFESPTAIIIALTWLIEALRRLVKSLHSLTHALSKFIWPSIAHALKRARAHLIEEITLPRPSPVVNKAARVLYAATFYVLTLQCLCLLLADGILVITSDATPWRKLLGACVLVLIVLAGRFCFTQGEKIRVELSIDSRPIW